MTTSNFALLAEGRVFRRNGQTYTKTSYNTARRDGESGTVCTVAPFDSVEVPAIRKGAPVSVLADGSVIPFVCGEGVLVDLSDLERFTTGGEVMRAATNPETIRTPYRDYRHPSYEQAVGRANRPRPLWHFAAWAVGCAALVVGGIAVGTGFLHDDSYMIVGGAVVTTLGWLLARRYNRRTN